jgi:hypothetical protein
LRPEQVNPVSGGVPHAGSYVVLRAIRRAYYIEPMFFLGRIVTPVVAAVGFATALYLFGPRAIDAGTQLAAQDDPARLADYAVSKSLTAPVAQAEIESALAAGDAELAASFLDLAREHGVGVDPALASRVEAANRGGAQAVHAVASFAHGFVTGTPDDLAGLAGTAAGDLFVFGDIRDAVREGTHLARGEPADELVLGLAGAGIAITAGAYLTAGVAAPVRVGLSLVKAARRTGRLAAPLAAFMTRSVREAVDTRALGAAMSKASLTAPGVAVRAARDAVKLEKADGVVMLADDIGRVQASAGTRAVFEGLKIAEEPEDVARLARLSAAKGGKTRAILKLAGRAALVLTSAAFDLASLLFAVICAVFGFCASVKRTTERLTEGYLRWRKKRRRARLAAAPVAALA